MRLLIDTHVLVWATEGNDALRGRLWRTVLDATTLYLSAVSIYEMEVKMAAGRLTIEGDYLATANRLRCRPLDFNADHAREAARLPLLHRDPFDRMLIAQARVEGLTLATADSNIRRYDVATVG